MARRDSTIQLTTASHRTSLVSDQRIITINGHPKQPVIIIPLGAARCGKGTHIEAIHETTGIPVFSLGQTFRDVARRDPHGEIALAIKHSKMVSDSIVCRLTKRWLLEQIKKPRKETSRPPEYFLDGPIRNLAQQEELMEHFADRGYFVKVIWFTTRPEICAERLPRPNRPEDLDSDQVRYRIRLYYEETLPVKDHFSKYGVSVADGNMLEVDNAQLTKQETAGQIIRFLGLPISPEQLFPQAATVSLT